MILVEETAFSNVYIDRIGNEYIIRNTSGREKNKIGEIISSNYRIINRIDNPKILGKVFWLIECMSCKKLFIIRSDSCDTLKRHNCNLKESVESKIKELFECMHRRCSVDPNYKNVKICDEWFDYETFRKWDELSQYKFGLTIDRIDNSLGYNADNCRLASPLEQARNRKDNILYEQKTPDEISRITGLHIKVVYDKIHKNIPVSGMNANKKVYIYNGETTSLPKLAEKYGINYNTLKSRIQRGKSIEEAISGSTTIRKE